MWWSKEQEVSSALPAHAAVAAIGGASAGFAVVAMLVCCDSSVVTAAVVPSKSNSIAARPLRDATRIEKNMEGGA